MPRTRARKTKVNDAPREVVPDFSQQALNTDRSSFKIPTEDSSVGIGIETVDGNITTERSSALPTNGMVETQRSSFFAQTSDANGSITYASEERQPIYPEGEEAEIKFRDTKRSREKRQKLVRLGLRWQQLQSSPEPHNV